MDVHTLVMISAMNGSRVAQYMLNSIIATWNMFCDGTMDGCVHFGHDICYEGVWCSRAIAPFNYCDLEHVS